MLKKLAVLLVTILTMTLVPAANADVPIFVANTPDNRVQPNGMNYKYSMVGMSLKVMQSKPGELVVKVNFNVSLGPNAFMPYGNSVPLLRVKLLTGLSGTFDNTGYLWLEAPNNIPYQGLTPIPANGTYYSDGKSGVPQGRQSISDCKPMTWMDAGGSSDWVAFSIDRNCVDLPDTFWMTTFLDSDIYASTSIADSKYAPADPIWIDMRGVPRPPKMKNQTVAFNGYIGTQNLDDPQTSVNVTSSLGLPVTVTSLTPDICAPSINGFKVNIALLKAGTCSLDAFAPGNDLTNPSPHVGTSFTVNPKVMINQEFYWTEPDMVQVGDDPFDLFIYSSSHLDVTVTSLSPGVCQFRDPSNPSVVTPVGEGDCVISVSQAGNDKYYPRLGDQATFWIDAAPVVTPTSKPSPRPTRTRSGSGGGSGGGPTIRQLGGTATASAAPTVKVTQKAGVGNLAADGSPKVTIKCKKGLLTKTVEGSKKKMPTCPKGYTKVK